VLLRITVSHFAPCRLFYGYWPNTNARGLTTLVVEQVSHHPPITAYYIANTSRGITLEGHNAQKTSFSGNLFALSKVLYPRPKYITGGNIIVKQVGHATLTVSLPDGTKEDYLITLPRLRIEGLWYGSPYIELTDNSYIQSSSGWLSTIKYQGKGYFSGKSHTFKADLTPPIGSGSSFQTSSFEGQWNTKSKYLRTGAVFTDVTGPKEEVTVRPVEEQGEWESRTLWCKVAKGIRESDFETAAREKSRIEVWIFPTIHIFFPLLTRGTAHLRWNFVKQNEQRQRRRDEVAAGTTWELKHFVHQDGDPLCRSFFFSLTASLMSRSQTNVWASYSKPSHRPKICTSIRTTVLRLNTRKPACNYYSGWTTTTTILPTPALLPSLPSLPCYIFVARSREFETGNLCNPVLYTYGLGKSYRPLHD